MSSSPSLGRWARGTLAQGWPGRAAQIYGGTAGWLGGASSPSWAMPAALGAGGCASEAGSPAGGAEVMPEQGWVALPWDSPFLRQSCCLCQAGG